MIEDFVESATNTHSSAGAINGDEKCWYCLELYCETVIKKRLKHVAKDCACPAGLCTTCYPQYFNLGGSTCGLCRATVCRSPSSLTNSTSAGTQVVNNVEESEVGEEGEDPPVRVLCRGGEESQEDEESQVYMYKQPTREELEAERKRRGDKSMMGMQCEACKCTYDRIDPKTSILEIGVYFNRIKHSYQNHDDSCNAELCNACYRSLFSFDRKNYRTRCLKCKNPVEQLRSNCLSKDDSRRYSHGKKYIFKMDLRESKSEGKKYIAKTDIRESNSNGKNQVCKYFDKGRYCRYGSNCRFQHINQNSSSSMSFQHNNQNNYNSSSSMSFQHNNTNNQNSSSSMSFQHNNQNNHNSSSSMSFQHNNKNNYNSSSSMSFQHNNQNNHNSSSSMSAADADADADSESVSTEVSYIYQNTRAQPRIRNKIALHKFPKSQEQIKRKRDSNERKRKRKNQNENLNKKTKDS
jgi:hypothetical protein